VSKANFFQQIDHWEKKYSQEVSCSIVVNKNSLAIAKPLMKFMQIGWKFRSSMSLLYPSRNSIFSSTIVAANLFFPWFLGQAATVSTDQNAKILNCVQIMGSGIDLLERSRIQHFIRYIYFFSIDQGTLHKNISRVFYTILAFSPHWPSILGTTESVRIEFASLLISSQ